MSSIDALRNEMKNRNANEIANGRGKFFSLRTKMIVFTSLIIVMVCSGLSWYFIHQQAEFMKAALVERGRLLINNIAHTSRYSLITHDTVSLERMTEGVMAVKEVVYVVMTGPDGESLVAKTKGKLVDPRRVIRNHDQPLFPDVSFAQQLLHAPTTDPMIKVLKSKDTRTHINVNRGKAGTVRKEVIIAGETIYDFAIPIQPQKHDPSLFGPLAFESQEQPAAPKIAPSSKLHAYGVIQIGLTNTYSLQVLDTIIWNFTIITVLIIFFGIVATTLLANRIITPLRGLAMVANRIASGDFNAFIHPNTRDEVGQLTTSINRMTQALQQREHAISSHLETITKQVSQLATLNQTGMAITSTLDVAKIIETVLDLLARNLSFSRIVLVLFDPNQREACISRVAGIPKDLERQAYQIRIPVHDDQSLDADVLLRGNALLVTDVAMVADRIHPMALGFMQQVEVNSFVMAPIKTQHGILGYLAADKASEPCVQEDLELLKTVVNQVGVAMDNARVYKELETLTKSLEERVQHRTKALQEAIERLEELDRLKSAFVSIVSHEFRTPMTSIKGLVENMLDGLTGDLSEHQSYYLSRVKANIERLTRMINDLLDLSKIEAGRMELLQTEVSIPELLDEVIENLQRTALEQSLTLRSSIPETLPVIQGDHDKLYQVFTNLIGNAIKFTGEGGDIHVASTLTADRSIQVCVSDTGCGIPQEEQEAIFQRFYRSSSTPMEAQGAGLGLSICKSLVELHHGTIWVESSPGNGTKIFITLPITSSPS